MNINLLPWRETQRQLQKKKMSIMFITSILFSLLIIAVTHIIFVQKIDSQEKRNNYIKQEVMSLEKKIREISDLKERRKELLARMQVIQGLQGNRPVIVQMFDNLVRIIPQGVYLTSLVSEDGQLTITGIAENNGQISDMMRNLDRSIWFAKPNLTAVSALDEKKGNQFNLSVKQVMPSALKEN